MQRQLVEQKAVVEGLEEERKMLQKKIDEFMSKVQISQPNRRHLLIRRARVESVEQTSVLKDRPKTPTQTDNNNSNSSASSTTSNTSTTKEKRVRKSSRTLGDFFQKNREEKVSEANRLLKQQQQRENEANNKDANKTSADCKKQPSATENNKAQKSVSDTKKQSSIIDSKKQSSVIDSKKQSSVTDNKKQSSVTDTKKQSPVADTKKPSPVADIKRQNSVTENNKKQSPTIDNNTRQSPVPENNNKLQSSTENLNNNNNNNNKQQTDNLDTNKVADPKKQKEETKGVPFRKRDDIKTNGNVNGNRFSANLNSSFQAKRDSKSFEGGKGNRFQPDGSLNSSFQSKTQASIAALSARSSNNDSTAPPTTDYQTDDTDNLTDSTTATRPDDLSEKSVNKLDKTSEDTFKLDVKKSDSFTSGSSVDLSGSTQKVTLRNSVKRASFKRRSKCEADTKNLASDFDKIFNRLSMGNTTSSVSDADIKSILDQVEQHQNEQKSLPPSSATETSTKTEDEKEESKISKDKVENEKSPKVKSPRSIFENGKSTDKTSSVRENGLTSSIQAKKII